MLIKITNIITVIKELDSREQNNLLIIFGFGIGLGFVIGIEIFLFFIW